MKEYRIYLLLASILIKSTLFSQSNTIDTLRSFYLIDFSKQYKQLTEENKFRKYNLQSIITHSYIDDNELVSNEYLLNYDSINRINKCVIDGVEIEYEYKLDKPYLIHFKEVLNGKSNLYLNKIIFVDKNSKILTQNVEKIYFDETGFRKTQQNERIKVSSGNIIERVNEFDSIVYLYDTLHINSTEENYYGLYLFGRNSKNIIKEEKHYTKNKKIYHFYYEYYFDDKQRVIVKEKKDYYNKTIERKEFEYKE